MRGHLEARGKGAWRAKVYIGRDALSGKPRYISRTIHGNKREAENALSQLLVEAVPGSTSVGDGTFDELATRWLGIASSSLSPTTVQGYRRLLDQRILPSLGSKKVRSIRALDLDVLYSNLQRRDVANAKPLSSLTIRNVHALVRRLLSQGVKWGWCTSNVALRASPPRAHAKEPRVPTPTEVAALITSVQDRDPEFACFLRLAAVTGARRGELCALRWTDVVLEKTTISITRSLVDGRTDELVEKSTKTHSSRTISLDDETIDLLRRHRARALERAQASGASLPAEAFVFAGSVDGALPWRPHRTTLAFQRLARTNGLTGVRLHDLRHFAASRMLVAGVPVKTVSGRLGHANAATTLNVYAHFLESSDSAAAAVLGDLLDEASEALEVGSV